jgi:hypothetical protein
MSHVRVMPRTERSPPPRHRSVVVLVSAVALFGAASGTEAQSSRRPTLADPPATRANLKTFVEFTILTPRAGGQLEAQRWAKMLADLGVTVQMRVPVIGDELTVNETIRGTLRTVRVVGQLGAEGRLEFANRAFTPNDLRKLDEWIRELKTYGAQGAPEGQPLWGLSEAQFTQIYQSLSTAVETELEGQTLSEALTQLPLPAAHPLRMPSSADAWLAQHPPQPIANRVQGLACGTVLALVLAEAGLGFHPARTPEGSIELRVQPLRPGSPSWPVGWTLPEGTTGGDVAPGLYKFVEVGFDDAALQDVLDAAAAAIDVPILVDYYAVRQTGVDLEQKTVSYPLKRTSWSLMLNTVLRKANLIKEVRADELGRAFVYVAPFVPTPVEKPR